MISDKKIFHENLYDRKMVAMQFEAANFSDLENR
jgi:hypothetical protein